MRRSHCRAVGALALLLFVAIAASNADGPPDGDREPVFDTRNALVWIFRYKRVFGYASHPAVFCDEQKVAKMVNGRYFLLTLEPGVHSIHSTGKGEGVEMSFESGREYFLEVRVSDSPTFSGYKFVVDRASRYRGAEAIGDLRPLEPDEIIDKSRVTSVDFASISP
jgi:hypothetical protein